MEPQPSFGSAASFSSLAAGSSVIVGSFVSGGDATVVRTRGMLQILTDQRAATEEVHGALGMAVVSQDAFDSGIAAVPTPISDIGSNSWLLWTPFEHAFGFGSNIGIQEPSSSVFTFDSKAMRKFNADQRLVVVLENSRSAFGLRFHLIIRTLVVLKGTGG